MQRVYSCHATRIFLREVDVSASLGTGKAIAIVHPIIANNLLDKIATKKGITVSDIALNFLRSPLMKKEFSFTRTYLQEGAKRMLSERKKYEYGDDSDQVLGPDREDLVCRVLRGWQWEIY